MQMSHLITKSKQLRKESADSSYVTVCDKKNLVLFAKYSNIFLL